jgi:hypothetical protein
VKLSEKWEQKQKGKGVKRGFAPEGRGEQRKKISRTRVDVIEASKATLSPTYEFINNKWAKKTKKIMVLSFTGRAS